MGSAKFPILCNNFGKSLLILSSLNFLFKFQVKAVSSYQSVCACILYMYIIDLKEDACHSAVDCSVA